MSEDAPVSATQPAASTTAPQPAAKVGGMRVAPHKERHHEAAAETAVVPDPVTHETAGQAVVFAGAPAYEKPQDRQHKPDFPPPKPVVTNHGGAQQRANHGIQQPQKGNH